MMRKYFQNKLFIYILFLKKLVMAQNDYIATLPSAPNAPASGCPDGYQRVNNGCYQFLQGTKVSREIASKNCTIDYAVLNSTIATYPRFNGTKTHLIAFEALAETIAMFFWLKGNGYIQNFYTDGVYSSSQYSRYWEWSNMTYTTFGYLAEKFTKNKFIHLAVNSSGSYQLYDTDGSGLNNYICEAQVPCADADNVCKNGTCYVNSGRAICKCYPGFAGVLCEVQLDNCESVPCLHGGTCINMINNYSCSCTPYYEGPNCDIQISYKFESARTFLLSLSVGIVGIILFVLCLMDLPWEAIVKAIRNLKLKKESTKIEQEEKSKTQPVEVKKVNYGDIIASEQEMLRRFKAALNQTKQKKLNSEMQKRLVDSSLATSSNTSTNELGSKYLKENSNLSRRIEVKSQNEADIETGNKKADELIEKK